MHGGFAHVPRERFMRCTMRGVAMSTDTPKLDGVATLSAESLSHCTSWPARFARIKISIMRIIAILIYITYACLSQYMRSLHTSIHARPSHGALSYSYMRYPAECKHTKLHAVLLLPIRV